MTSWADVHATSPAFADSVRRTFAIRKHATMATTRLDGAPRISGTEVQFSDDGEIYIGIMSGAKRADDLRRDPRLAIHCPTEDPAEGDAAGWPGDGKIFGTAIEVEPHRYRVDIERVVLTKAAEDESGLEISVWVAGEPLKVLRRS
jgi:hypothetical protein